MFPFPALSTSLEAMAQQVSSHGWYPILWPFQWKDIEPLGEFGTYNNGWISPTNMIIIGWCSMEIQKGNNEFTIQMLGCFLRESFLWPIRRKCVEYVERKSFRHPNRKMVPMEIMINFLNKRLKEEVDLIHKNEETFSHTIVILHTKESHKKRWSWCRVPARQFEIIRGNPQEMLGILRIYRKTPYRSWLPPTQYRFSKLLWIKTLDSAGLHQHSADYGCSSPQLRTGFP